MEKYSLLKHLVIAGYLISMTTTAMASNDSPDNRTHHISINDAIKDGKPYLAFRLRHENAIQTDLKTAKATTLRSKVGYLSGIYSNTSLTVEAINIASFLGQRYNPGVTDISRPTYSTIADPKGTGITKLNLNFTGLDATKIIFGRQYLNLDNERFIGAANYRQFPQTFDAVSVSSDWFATINLFYAFLDQVHNNKSNSRTSEGRNKLNTHLFKIAWDGFDYGILSGYTYFNKDKTFNTNSHLILGVRAVSTENVLNSYGINYALEFAQQQGKFGNPNHYKAYYTHGEIGKPINNIEAKLGFERLTGKSDSTGKSFITPLGSIRNFNGLSEAITAQSTNERGIQNLYLKIGSKIDSFALNFAYHNFRAGRSKKFGNEFNITASIDLNYDVTLSTTYAKFNPSSNSGIKNTRRVWVQLDTKFM